MNDRTGIQTKAIHAGARTRHVGSVTTPIFRSSMYVYGGETYHDHGYIRLSNTPNHEVVTEKIAALEGTEAAIVTASGMAAIATTLLSLLKPGDEILTHRNLYSGTLGLLGKELREFGIAWRTEDATNPGAWQAPSPRLRVVYVETIANPTLEIADLGGVARYCQAHGLILVVDNTFASPIGCRPAAHGADLVIESCSKYLNGHSDLVGGSVAGRFGSIGRIKRTNDHLGGCMDPQVAWLLERGLKTLPARFAAHSQSALAVAEALAKDGRLATVRYPGLASNSQAPLAARLLDHGGGIVSIEFPDGDSQADAFLAGLSLFTVAVSLGGAESLAMRQAANNGQLRSDSGLAPTVPAGLVRLSIGLEATEDLLADLLEALDRSGIFR